MTSFGFHFETRLTGRAQISAKRFGVTTLLAAPLLAAALALGACDGATDGPTPEAEPSVAPGVEPDGEPGVEPAGFPLRLCILTATSGSIFGQAIEFGFQPRFRCEQNFEPGTSEEEARALCLDRPDLVEVYEEAVSGGRVQIDQTKFEACVTKARAVRNEGASVVAFENDEGPLFALFDDPDCTGAFVGTRNENEECVQPWDCSGDLLCEAEQLDDDTRCLTPAGDDQRCGGSRSCAEGLSCMAGRCAAPVAIGRPCTISGAPCVDDSRCVLTSETPIEVYTCVANIADGEACDVNEDQCVTGSACTSGVCAAIVNPDDGEACTTNGEACAQTCSVCRPSEPLGATTCQAYGDVDDACGETDQCRPGLFCAVDTNRCALDRQETELCNGNEPCAAGLFCSDGTCAALGDTDARCGDDDECISTHYCFNQNSCRPRGGPGANCNATTPCADDYECLETVCQAGREGDVCRVVGDSCEFGLACIVAGEDCPPNDGQCIQNNPLGTCEVPPVTGEPCDGKFNVCDAFSYCPDGNVCVAKLDAGVECEVSDHCASGTCLDGGTCATSTPSCLASQGNGLIMMLFGAAIPVALRLRRRRKKSAPSPTT